MYTKALFPESRGDILGLLETMESVPNHSESTVRMILNQHIRIPDELTNDIMRLVELTCRGWDASFTIKNDWQKYLSQPTIEDLAISSDRFIDVNRRINGNL